MYTADPADVNHLSIERYFTCYKLRQLSMGKQGVLAEIPAFKGSENLCWTVMGPRLKWFKFVYCYAEKRGLIYSRLAMLLFMRFFSSYGETVRPSHASSGSFRVFSGQTHLRRQTGDPTPT